MTSKQRAYLRSLANELEPVVQIGKSGVTPETVTAVGEAFSTHELIKLGVLKNCAEEPHAIADCVAERTHAEVVQVIGKKIVLYRQDRKNPKIVLPRA